MNHYAIQKILGNSIIYGLFLTFTLMGCSGRYELQKDNQGRTIRVDKWFGDIALLKDNKLIELSKPNESYKDSATKEWPKIQLRGNYKDHELSVSTKWSNQNIAYVLTVEPSFSNWPSLIKNPYHSFKIHFLDKAGFIVRKIEVPLSSMTNILNENGKSNGYQVSELLPMTLPEYLKIDSWNIEWNFQ